MAPDRDAVGRPLSGATTPPSAEIGTLAEEKELVIGSEYWVVDETGAEVWALVEVLELCDAHVVVKLVDCGKRKEVDLDLEEMHSTNPNVVADMTALHHIHEPGILHNLKERSRPWRQTPYTFMGTILLAVNPLKAVPVPPLENFMGQSLDSETPHPYAIAELSYRQMQLAGGRPGTNQSIVVSGESGAGKTETVKIILSYLARRSAGADDTLETRVLESSPILESFGNAKTLRNDNSSRFGKFLKLRFTSGEYAYLDGASVEPYLLEKSRVLAQGEGERNFHILYEMIAGAMQSGMAKELKLEGASNYRILSSSGCVSLDGVDDADRFKAIQDAFTTVGVDSDAQMQVWQALSAVLHLSALSFQETDHQEGPVAAISDRATLGTVASLLGVGEKALEDMLTLKVVPVTRGEVFTKHLGVKEAVRARDAAVKSLYEAMFLWVVRAINLSLGGTKVAGDDKQPFIGLLDIFGFENFGHKNNLEQLLINYANESLQGDFNRQVFENELRVYAEEGIDVTVSPAVYTSSCLRMLTGKRDGVLPILDDVCSQPLPSDKRYLERLHVAFTRRQGQGMDVTVKAGSRDVLPRGPRSIADSDDGVSSVRSLRKGGGGGSDHGWSSSASTNDTSEIRSLEWLGRGSLHSSDSRTEQHESFWVNHYASKVLYTVDGWVERNMDSVPQSFSDTMLSSGHQVVFDAAMGYASGMNEAMETKEKKGSGAGGDAPIPRKLGGRRESKTQLSRRTVSGNFMVSMTNLSATLAGTVCGFVRCVKPNAAMDFGIFDSQYVVDQLRCLGVLRTCEVLKIGMPTRISYMDLKQSLGDGILEAERLFEGEPEKALVAAILWAFDVPCEAFRLGAKRVFFRAGQIAVLHKILNETPADKLPWVLSRLRLALANRRMARIAAEEAEDFLAEAEAAVMEAEALSSDTVRPQIKKLTPLSPGASADQDMREIVATVEKARRAASNASQVKNIIKVAKAEGVGETAPGASEKIQEASDSALADIAKAAERATELEKLSTLGVFGVDGATGETSAARELHIALRQIRDGLAGAQKLWRSAEEAADKCQADLAVEKSKAAKQEAETVVEKAKKVAETSKTAIDIARRQRKAREVTTRATEKALRTFRSLQVVARQATLEEKRARANKNIDEAKTRSSPLAATTGRGHVAAAKAALAAAAKYENLTDDQKQQRAEEREAASAEAAVAIAEAAKEEEQKRLELIALEKERLLELEEEANAAAEEVRELEMREALEALDAMNVSADGRSEGGDSMQGSSVHAEKSRAATGGGMASPASSVASGMSVVSSARAAASAVETATGLKSYTTYGASSPGSSEKAATGGVPLHGTTASTRPPYATSGWGDKNNQPGPGSIKARARVFSGDKINVPSGSGTSPGGFSDKVGAGSRSPPYARGGAGAPGTGVGTAGGGVVAVGIAGGIRSPPSARSDTSSAGGVARSPPLGRKPNVGFSGSAGGGSARSPPASVSGRSIAGSYGSRSSSISSPPPKASVGAGAVSGFSPGVRAGVTARDTSSPSKRTSRREEAMAALAAAEAAAVQEEEEWARKTKMAEEERRKARGERIKLAAAAAEAATREEEEERESSTSAGSETEVRRGVTRAESGGVRARALQLEQEEKKRAAVKEVEQQREAAAFADRALKRADSAGRESSTSSLAERTKDGVETRLPRKRSMRRSGWSVVPGGGSGEDVNPATAGQSAFGGGGGMESSERGAGGVFGEGDRVTPWPEAAIAAVAEDDEKEGEEEDEGDMEAKKPLNGWHTSAGNVPWRSPERAPEYGGSRANGGKAGMARCASFTGDPMHPRNAPWDRSEGTRTISKNHSLDEDFGEDANVSWGASPKEEDGKAAKAGSKSAGGAPILESMLFKDDAAEMGVVEAKVMNYNSENKRSSAPRRAPTWVQYYFRLREGVLTKSAPRRSSFPGMVTPSEDMVLTGETKTSFTNTKNCFCVSTGDDSWFLLARSLDDMKRWMTALNKQARQLFMKANGVPQDDYWGEGRKGRFFYRMVEGSVPQWILTHPKAKAPRTGDGLFPGEVIEVTQVLGSDSLTFLRLANDRGWTYARSPTDGGVLFEDLAGGVSEDTEEYSFPSGAKGIVPILHGPGLRTQATGVTIRPGERAVAAERFTPVTDTNVIFIKLADGRGWVPVKTKTRGPATVLQGW